MELSKKKTQAIIAFVLIVTITALTVVVPAGAQLQSGERMPTFLQLSVSPDPVGKGQPLYINAFMTKPTVTATVGGAGTNYIGIWVRMTRPDGSTYDFPAKTSDPTGGTWFTYEPELIGEYTFQAFYPGQHISETVSAMFGSPTTYDFYYDPSESEVVTVNVQEEQIEWIYRTPGPPEEYWTRPIYATNWDWDVLGGHWFGLGVPAFANTGGYDAMGNYQPYSKAPNTPHIVWSKPTHIGGLPGGHIEGTQETNYMSTTITKYFFEPVILNGILYYAKMEGPNGNIHTWEALNIRTGEVLWTRSAGESGSEVIRMGSIALSHTMQEYGSWAHIYGAEGGGFFGGINALRVYDAWTGDYIATIENPQSPSYIVQEGGNTPGALLGYYSSGGNLIMWNSSKLLGPSGTGYDLNYAPSGTLAWADGIEWTAPIPTQVNGNPVSLSVSAVTRDVILLRSAPTPGMWISASLGWQVTAGLDATTGALLWGPINQTLPFYEDITLIAAGDGAYVLHNKDTNQAWVYNLMDGSLVRGPIDLVGNAWSTLQRSSDIAYGLCYIWDGGGWVNAINVTTGEIEWHFNRGSSGYDTPYGVYLLWYNDAIADGKIYLSEGAMYNPPLHPARTICLNATTGDLIWSILSYTGRQCPAIADGHMIVWNSFDMKIYSFGKGPTETTVTAPDTVVQLGTSVLIRGTVMDISPGAKQDGVIQRFPKGLPAVADENMREWMEYVYMQQIKPEDFEGVKVFLKIQDPNGEWYSAYVTTDENGVFSHMWAPAIVGEYHVTAMFEGSESYWSSRATTTFGIDEAADGAPSADEIADKTAARLPAYPEIPAYLTIDLVILILAVVGVVIGLIAYMALRKQK